MFLNCIVVDAGLGLFHSDEGLCLLIVAAGCRSQRTRGGGGREGEDFEATQGFPSPEPTFLHRSRPWDGLWGCG